MPVEKSGQNEFDFQYGDDFGEHIEQFDPDFAKVLVRYNPDGDAEMNERQLGRLKRLADWLHENDRKFLFELLVPAEAAQLESVGGDIDRYDAELRPELMRRAIEDIQDYGIEVDIWKIEGVDAREDAEMLAEQTRTGEGREGVVCVLLGRGASDEKVDHWLRAGRAGRRLHRLRDRPLDLVGRAEGLPRRRASTRDAAAEQIADNYLRFVRVYDDAESARRASDAPRERRRPCCAAAALACLRRGAAGARRAGAGIGGRVVAVSDGDTIRVRLDSGATSACATSASTRPRRSSRARRAVLRRARARAQRAPASPTRRATLELDVELRDRYGRLLAYVYSGADVRQRASWCARATPSRSTVPPNVRHATRHQAARARGAARRAGAVGLPARQGKMASTMRMRQSLAEIEEAFVEEIEEDRERRERLARRAERAPVSGTSSARTSTARCASRCWCSRSSRPRSW